MKYEYMSLVKANNERMLSMIRHDMIERVGASYVTANIEGGEYSYVQEAGSKEALEKALGKSFKHFKLDIRFEDDDYVVLIETSKSLSKMMRSSLLNICKKKEFFIMVRK